MSGHVLFDYPLSRTSLTHALPQVYFE